MNQTALTVARLSDAPIISPDLDTSIGDNIQGPSLIRIPDWVPGRLADYYLYFADHKGRYIRLAFADDLQGPWQIHRSGSLQLSESLFPVGLQTGTPEQVAAARERAKQIKLPHDLLQELETPHIASPDVHVDADNQRIIMYFHGLERFGVQKSRVAVSEDGIHFKAQPEILGKTYMRVFEHQALTYALAMAGTFYRSEDRLAGFEVGPTLFEPNMRHSAVLKRDNLLHVFWTRVGDVPERILLTSIDISGDWHSWRSDNEVEVLRPEHDWEGSGAPLEPSIRSVAYGNVNQLRDPCIFEEAGDVYLLYACAGESGIGIAKLDGM